MFPTTDCITFDCSSFTILCCLWLRSLNRSYDIGSEFDGNDGHYYGRIVVSAETPVFCPALETVAETAGGECVLEGVHDSLSKGFVKHCCRVEWDKNHTLHRWGVWNMSEPHISALVPSPHKAFVQFIMSITHIQPTIAQYSAPRDIETCLMVLLDAHVTVYSVVDISEPVEMKNLSDM